MDIRSLIIQYFLRHIDECEDFIDNFGNKRYYKSVDDLDALDLIVNIVELRTYKRTFRDMQILLDIVDQVKDGKLHDM